MTCHSPPPSSSVPSRDGSSSGSGGDGKKVRKNHCQRNQTKRLDQEAEKTSSETSPPIANEANLSTDGPVTDVNAMDIDIDNTMMEKEAMPTTDKTSFNDNDSEHVTNPEREGTAPGQSLTSTADALDPPHSHEGASTSASSSTISPLTVSGNSHSLPSFLSPAMITYLRGVLTSSSWQDLLSEYLDFEREGPITGVCFSLSVFSMYNSQQPQKLSTSSQPDSVTPWIKRHIQKKHEPIEVEENDYGPQFCAWWTAIQPTWRILPGGQYSREVPDNETWASLRKGGSAGLFVVVVALSWWVRAAGDVVDQSRLRSVIGDLHWVVQQVRGLKQAEKRGRSEVDSARKGKWYVFIRCICCVFLILFNDLL